MKKLLGVSLVFVSVLMMTTTSSFARDFSGFGSINVTDGDRILRINVGDGNYNDSRMLMQRIRNLEMAVG